jgi:hypothetical protein
VKVRLTDLPVKLDPSSNVQRGVPGENITVADFPRISPALKCRDGLTLKLTEVPTGTEDGFANATSGAGVKLACPVAELVIS